MLDIFGSNFPLPFYLPLLGPTSVGLVEIFLLSLEDLRENLPGYLAEELYFFVAPHFAVSPSRSSRWRILEATERRQA